MARVARELGVTRSAVAMWQRVPAERVVEVEEITGIRREDLRPDLYREHEPASPASDSPSPFTGRINQGSEWDGGNAGAEPTHASDSLSPFTGRIGQRGEREAVTIGAPSQTPEAA